MIMTNEDNNGKIRIQKYLSTKGVCSRREAERMIERRKIKVNGKKAVIGQAVDDQDHISINGKLIKKEERKIYYLLNKPKGYLSATKDKKGLPITDLIHTSSYIWPVGRLDVNTSGIIFITNDGDFTKLVTSPASNIKKTYIAKVNKIDFTNEDLRLLMNGITLDDGYKTQKAHEVSIVKVKGKYSHVKLTISEGKNNQVRRMFLALDCKVMELKRVGIGGFKIHQVPDVGSYIVVSYGDIQRLINK